MAVETFESAAIVLEADPKQRVNFQVFPETISDSKSAQWADVAIIGRSEPIKTYSHSTPRVLSFPLYFVASVDQGDEGTAEAVKSKVEFCQSLIYSQATESGIAVFPPVCILVIGTLIKSRVVAKQVSVKYKGPWTYEQRQRQSDTNSVPFGFSDVPDNRPYVALPIIAEVMITMEEVNVIPDDSAFIRNGRKL